MLTTFLKMYFGHIEVHYDGGWEDGPGGKVLVVKVYELILKVYDLSLDPQHPCMSQLFTIGIQVVHMNMCG